MIFLLFFWAQTHKIEHIHSHHRRPFRCHFLMIPKATVYNAPIKEAVKISGASCGLSGLYSKVKRWKGNQTPAVADVNNSPHPPAAINITSGSAFSPLTSESAHTNANANTVSSINTARESALSSIPSWLDKESVAGAMSKRKKRTATQTCQDNFDTNAKKKRRDERYKEAFKTATSLLHANMCDHNKAGKRGYGAVAVAKQINNTILTSPNDRKLSKTALHRAATLSNQVGKSPPTGGRPQSIPSALPYALATHSAMMQISGEGEASAARIKSTMHALVAQTQHENKFSVEYAWRRTRKNHPEIMNPVRAKGNEDRRVDWLTYKNIIDWNARAKQLLINIGMAKDEPGEICKLS